MILLQLHLPHPWNGIRWSRGGSEIGHPWALGCCWPWAIRFSWTAIMGGTGWTSVFSFLFFLHCCEKFEICPSWMKPLLKKSLLCFWFFFLSCFVFSGLSCSIPYSLCALCVDILEVCFHSPNTTRQKGKRPNTFHSLQTKSRDVKENSKILQCSWSEEQSQRQMCFNSFLPIIYFVMLLGLVDLIF